MVKVQGYGSLQSTDAVGDASNSHEHRRLTSSCSMIRIAKALGILSVMMTTLILLMRIRPDHLRPNQGKKRPFHSTSEASHPEFPQWPELEWKPTTNASVFVGFLRVCNASPNRTFSYHAVDDADIPIDAPCRDDTPSPLIRMQPRITYKLVLINHADEPTNLHTHGLHVSGVGAVDDVTRSVDPGNCLVYVYYILDDADVGTFWYHSHRHPLAAHQVSQGAHGMLVVEETPSQLEQYPQHLQTFFRDRQVLLQYTCVDDKSQKPHQRRHWINGRQDPIHLSWQEEEWYYVRISAVVISHPINYVQIEPPIACEARVVAYDGVYRSRIPHETSSNIHMLTTSSRVDLAMKCSQNANLYFHQGKLSKGSRLVIIHLGADNHHEAQSSVVAASPYWDAEQQTRWSPRRPYYIPNLGDAVSVTNLGNVSMDSLRDADGVQRLSINQHRWDPAVPMQAFEMQQTVEWKLWNTKSHPFHVHINRMQIVQSNGCGYRYEEGEYYDSIAAHSKSCRVRNQFWDYGGRVVAHCHKLKHEDRGMMVWFNITHGPGAGESGKPQETCADLSLF